MLDPHLSDWVTTLCAAVREHSGKRHEVDVFLSIVYVLCKTRGYKTIGTHARARAHARSQVHACLTAGAPAAAVRFMPHGVTDVEFVLSQLELRQRTAAQSSSSCADLPVAQQCALDAFEGVWWQARYALLVWLSIVVLVPFGFEAIDVDASSVSAGADASSPAVRRCRRRRLANFRPRADATDRASHGRRLQASSRRHRPHARGRVCRAVSPAHTVRKPLDAQALTCALSRPARTLSRLCSRSSSTSLC